MCPVKLLNQLCILKTSTLETEQIHKYHTHSSLEMGMRITYMSEPMKGIFKNVAPDKLRGWSNKWRWLRLETLKGKNRSYTDSFPNSLKIHIKRGWPTNSKRKNNKIMIPLKHPSMAFLIFILIMRFLKFLFNYFRALKTLQCHLLKAKCVVHNSP